MITIFAGALRFLGLSQADAAEMLQVGEQAIKNMSAGRSRVPDGIWADLRGFAVKREAAIAAHRPTTIADAERAQASISDPGRVFPTPDTYVTMLAAAALTTSGLPPPLSQDDDERDDQAHLFARVLLATIVKDGTAVGWHEAEILAAMLSSVVDRMIAGSSVPATRETLKSVVEQLGSRTTL